MSALRLSKPRPRYPRRLHLVLSVWFAVGPVKTNSTHRSAAKLPKKGVGRSFKVDDAAPLKKAPATADGFDGLERLGGQRLEPVTLGEGLWVGPRQEAGCVLRDIHGVEGRFAYGPRGGKAIGALLVLEFGP